MDRRIFLEQLVLSSITMMTLSSFRKETDTFKPGDRMPALFIGHGSPMNAIEDNEFSRAWRTAGKSLPPPNAILCVSAHWQTSGTKVTAMDHPKTIHDFYGFPKELNEKEYPAPGAKSYAQMTKELVKKTPIALDMEWGLDHGTWSVLASMYPEAKIPVYQISLDYSKPPSYHYELSKELSALRNKGVLIIGSGNIVHNLGMMQWKDQAFEWASEFDEKVKNLILKKEHNPLINYETLGPSAKLSIPTNEHYLPMLYTLALQEKDEEVSFFSERTTMGSVSMRSFKLG